MNRNLRVAAAAAVIAVAFGAVLLIGRGLSSNVGAPSPSPVPSPAAALSPSAASTQVAAGDPWPTRLNGRWMGGNRSLPGVAADSGTSILFSSGAFEMTPSNRNGDPFLGSPASAIGGQAIRLETTGTDVLCQAGNVGLYYWSLTSDGRTLTLTAVRDDCVTRLGAVPGTWWLDGCKDTQTDCLGDVAAGTYQSQYISPRIKTDDTWGPVFGAVTYTVPDGWANSSDWPSTFGLTPSSDYGHVLAGDAEGSRSILLVTQPAPLTQKVACSQGVDSGVPRTVDAEIGWLQQVPGLVTSSPTATVIDGHQGQWIDIRLSPDWKTRCPGGPGPEVDYLAHPGGQIVGIVGTAQRQRVILLDLGGGDLMAIVVSTDTSSPFTAFAAQAMPVITSFQFK